MKAIVTVFKSELKTKPYVIGQIKTLCKQLQEIDEAFMFSPKDGKLVEFLTVLKFHKISYATHFDTKDEQPEKVKVQQV
jgi:hypothetical protein